MWHPSLHCFDISSYTLITACKAPTYEFELGLAAFFGTDLGALSRRIAVGFAVRETASVQVAAHGGVGVLEIALFCMIDSGDGHHGGGLHRFGVFARGGGHGDVVRRSQGQHREDEGE